MFEMLVAILVFSIVASPVLMLRAVFSRSWILMWLAALGSFILSILGMFSIGAFVFLLTCLQLVAVVAMRWRFSPLRWTVGLLLGVLIWVLLVPVQIYGYRWFIGIGAYQVVGIIALIVVLFPWRQSGDSLRRGDVVIAPARPHASPGAKGG
jgi:hypothetical protein